MGQNQIPFKSRKEGKINPFKEARSQNKKVDLALQCNVITTPIVPWQA